MPFDGKKSAIDYEILMNRLVVKGDKNVLPSRTLFFALGKNPATELSKGDSCPLA